MSSCSPSHLPRIGAVELSWRRWRIHSLFPARHSPNKGHGWERRRRGISTTILLLSASKYSRPSADHGRPADRGEMLTSPELPSRNYFSVASPSKMTWNLWPSVDPIDTHIPSIGLPRNPSLLLSERRKLCLSSAIFIRREASANEGRKSRSSESIGYTALLCSCFVKRSGDESTSLLAFIPSLTESSFSAQD